MFEIIKECGIKDTVNLIDDRTAQLIRLYEYYKNNPSQLDYGIFFDTVIILNPLFRERHG